MDSLIMRTVARVLIAGLAVWGPGTPVALAQVEITPEIREACQQFEPALRDIALTEVVPKLEEAAQPDASEAAKAEATIVETAAVAIHGASKTAAQLPTPDVATLQEALAQQAGVAAPVAQELAQRAHSAMEQCKTLLGAGDPVQAEAVLKSFQDECRTLGIDPAVLGGAREGALTFDRVAFDPAGDFARRCLEVHTASEVLQRAGVEFTGAPPDPAEVAKMIEAMNVSPEQKAEMVKMAEAYTDYCRDGNFDKMREVAMSNAREAYEQAMREGVTMTPEMAQRMAAEMGHTMDPRTMDPRMMEHATVDPRTIEHYVKEVENQNFDNKQLQNFEGFQFSEGHRACRSDEMLSGEAAEHAAHGHAGCSDP